MAIRLATHGFVSFKLNPKDAKTPSISLRLQIEFFSELLEALLWKYVASARTSIQLERGPAGSFIARFFGSE